MARPIDMAVASAKKQIRKSERKFAKKSNWTPEEEARASSYVERKERERMMKEGNIAPKRFAGKTFNRVFV